jgi:glycosyltransferase involved in cell wall biosynthesis
MPELPQARRRKISAIIACYRDAQAIPIMYDRLVAVFTKLDVDFEIIFVNDASPDDAEAVLEQLSERDARVIAVTHSRNFGSQSAFTSGMRICSGDAAVLLDGDLQDPPELIEAFYAKWLEGYDVVYGARVARDANRFLRVSYKIFYRLFRAASYVPVPLDAGDFSLMDRRVIDALNSLPETNRFLRGLRAWVGFRQIGVPYHRPERMFGTTTNSLLRNIGWARKAIFSFSYIPLRRPDDHRRFHSDRCRDHRSHRQPRLGANRSDVDHRAGPLHRWDPVTLPERDRVVSGAHL